MNQVKSPNRYGHIIISLILLSLAMFSSWQANPVKAQDEDQLIYLPLVANDQPTATPTLTPSPTPSPIPSPTPAPSGGRVVLSIYEYQNVITFADIYTMNSDGSDQVRLTTSEQGVVNQSPAWSPDGSKIAFARANNRTGRERGIYVINADGSNMTRLTNSDERDYDHAPVWSPDGSQIAYHTTNFGPAQIMVINSDGSNARQLTDFQTSESPHWSPDGTKIVFSSNQYEAGNAKMNIYVMNTDGSNKTRLTFNAEGDDNYPRWSPDGTKIAFWSTRGGVTETYIINADGSNEVQVPGIGQMEGSWSPDGTQFIFPVLSASQTDLDLYIINTDGTGLQRITQTANLLEAYPDWRP